MAADAQETIRILLKTNQEQEKTIADLRATIKDLRATVANLNETLDELKRKLFGRSSEKTDASASSNGEAASREETPEAKQTPEAVITVKEYTRARKKKSVRADLYEALPIQEVRCDVPEGERTCPDCDARMEHLGYKFVR